MPSMGRHDPLRLPLLLSRHMLVLSILSILHPCWMLIRCPGRPRALHTSLNSCSQARSWSCS